MPSSFDAEDVARVAEGLTRVERSWLEALADNSPATARMTIYRANRSHESGSRSGNRFAAYAFHHPDLIETISAWPSNYYRLTPLGEAVRQHLMEQSK